MHEFERQNAPSKSRIQDWVKSFETFGTEENLNSANEGRLSHPGRSRKRTNELIESVRESVQQSPKRSVRSARRSLRG